MRELIKNEGGDEKVLVTAIYLHDIGYGELIDKNYSLDDRLAVKEKHMEIGAARASNICEELGYEKEEIKKISHLIEVHDNYDELKEKDEILVMEADSLALLNYERAPTNLSKEDYQDFLENFKNGRKNYIKTATGKKWVKELLPQAEEYSKTLKQKK